MNLKELKSLVAEEYDKFMAEQDDDKAADAKDDKKDDKPKKPAAPKVKAGGDDLDLTDENPEETLRQIYDMLKDFFEGDDKKDDKKDDMPAMGDDSPMDMMENKKIKAKKTAKLLEETIFKSRFKKLANIKG